ncbi:hypothetical protein PRIPAC_84622, partial [Pristionchus pacificus]|uniref:Uncharacterized protein n=1 Tax=Pristionchus pacificus TaxID=54126 RepID=A0A2A6CCL9_PRIPA
AFAPRRRAAVRGRLEMQPGCSDCSSNQELLRNVEATSLPSSRSSSLFFPLLLLSFIRVP